MNRYEFLLETCGLSNIVCLPTCINDIRYYYDWRVTEEQVDSMINEYKSIYDIIWKKILNHDIVESALTDVKTDVTKLYTPKDGLYYNVYKIDFDRAFTTYIFETAKNNIDLLNDFTYLCNLIATKKLPQKTKKFLYNYTLTNLISKVYGIEYLYQLRKKVYDDVITVSKSNGEILKTEIDGAYIHVDRNKDIRFHHNVYGNLSFKKIKWIMFLGNKMIGKSENEKIIIKGYGKVEPNISKQTIKKFVESKNNCERNKILDEFFNMNRSHILDWGIKNSNGTKLSYHINGGTIISFECNNENDLEDINDMKSDLDRDKYIKRIFDVISSIMENVG